MTVPPVPDDHLTRLTRTFTKLPRTFQRSVCAGIGFEYRADITDSESQAVEAWQRIAAAEKVPDLWDAVRQAGIRLNGRDALGENPWRPEPSVVLKQEDDPADARVSNALNEANFVLVCRFLQLPCRLQIRAARALGIEPNLSLSSDEAVWSDVFRQVGRENRMGDLWDAVEQARVQLGHAVLDDANPWRVLEESSR